ncbi:hypothetical protein DE146DRAFT_485162 [Phaeosphaeria sp. MPI-PUGE-AT-0046c]|nr:hypothetical protein DE146DRAFT_485162 [Phaeosphaeria sp. MPI-PUGE-AT-0046c]
MPHQIARPNLPRQNNADEDLSILNEPPSTLKGPGLLHNLVAPASTATAIDFLEDGSKRRQLSYKTLHSLSDDLAQKITESHKRLGHVSTVIPVLLPQCPELYIVLLAILKAGKAFCPLSIDAPAERLEFILNDISADLIITDSSRGRTLHLKRDLTRFYVDQDLFEGGRHIFESPSNVSTNHLAYVLYTSGSTGLPKAVGVSHRAVTQSLLAHDRHIPHFTRFLQFAAPTFDVSIFEIFFPWYRGCTLVGRTRSHMLENLPESIRLLKADAAELTPTVVSNLLEGRSSVPDLKLLLTIGEMLKPDVVEEYGSSITKTGILWAMYGPTEAAIHCTLQPCMSNSASTRMIGFPLDTVSIFIAALLPAAGSSWTLSILPRGEEGELIVGGHQIAEEYINRPELTRASFIQHPQYGTLYRTGDRARLRGDGTIECLGRVIKGQVKVRGQRVELGEIEQVALKAKGCRAATISIVDDVLVAFCATGHRKVARTDILALFKQWLPAFMIPAAIFCLPRMPQLASGKIDEAALAAMYRQSIHHADSKEAEDDLTGSQPVLDLLRSRLNRNLTPESELTAIGCDSLQTIRLASALRASGYDVTALDILAAVTVRDLLQLTDLAQNSNGHFMPEKSVSIETSGQHIPDLEPFRTKFSHILPCTPIQEAMLAETMARRDAYCNWVEVELSSSFSFENIKEAVQKLAQCNEILRTGFHSAATHVGTFVQVVWHALDDSQFRHVPDFSRQFTLEPSDLLLRPLYLQVCTQPNKPRLLFQMHHALYDGWSFDLIIQDLEDLLCKRHVKDRPQFRELVRYHMDHDDSSRDADSIYWMELLRDRPNVSLPNFCGRNANRTTTRCFTSRSRVNVDTLLTRSNELMISPQVWFQAAVAYITALYTGSGDAVIGNVTSGRTIPVAGVEEIIGPCIASLPFHLRMSDMTSVRDIVYETQRQNRKSLEHCSLPLRQIAKLVNVHNGTRLFDVLFVWQQPIGSVSASSTTTRIIDSADELEFRVTLEFEPRFDHISVRATFDSSSIPEPQIKCLFRQIDDMVLWCLQNVDCHKTDIATCFSEEVRSIANPTPCQYLIQHGPAHAVEQWASLTPDKAAVSFFHRVNGTMMNKATATYSTLNRRANQLARALQLEGVHQGGLVAIIMDKSLHLYTAILAVLKLGAGYLPLVPDLPETRTRTILNEARIAVCISDSSSPSYLKDIMSLTLVNVDAMELNIHKDTNMDAAYNGADIAYAVFTSGSTGVPKGVLVTQDNLMSNLQYLSTIYPYTSTSKLLQSCSQAFDVSVFEIFFSWHVGICLCTAAKDDLFSDLEGAINQLGVTHLSLTPTVAALIDPDNVPHVQFLVTAGEAVTEHVRRKWAGRGLYQGYGPSETTNICTVRPSVSPSDLINNIGKPFDNTSAFVLDPSNSTILPRGSVGELCFGGQQVFRGYLNRSDLTTGKVFQHPKYGRVYRSGDLGLLLHDDSILFVGRLDDQVKLRGQRVELGEINSVVLDEKCTRDCSTLLLRVAQGPETLVTFWVPAGLTDPSSELLEVQSIRRDITAIFTALSARLPSYMVPLYCVPVDRLPITAQGKIDKRHLQQYFDHLSEEQLECFTRLYDECDGKEGSPPISGWEHGVAKILAIILKLPAEDIRRNSSFFRFGLDSISAISFSHRLREANFGDFTISEILKNPTLQHLAHLNETRNEDHTISKPFIKSLEPAIAQREYEQINDLFEKRGTSITKIRPCTPLQQAMLSSGHSDSSTSYSNVMLFTVNGDLELLKACWRIVLERHEIFRTAFVTTDEPLHPFVQVVLGHLDLKWHEFHDMIEARKSADRELVGLLQANMPPTWLATVTSTHSTQLLFGCHHAMYDGVAIQMLLKEVQMAYHRNELPSPVSYDVYLQQMLSLDFAEADKFWAASLRDFEPTAFPNLTSTANNGSATQASLQYSMQLPLGQIREACQVWSTTLLSIVHATWSKLLHFYTAESDICFGTVVSGRAHPGYNLEHLVAPCFNTLPVRIQFDFGNANLALVQQAHAVNLNILDYQLTPLRRIQTNMLREGGRLFDTLVILQQPSDSLDDTVWCLEEDNGAMNLPLVCEISQQEADDRLELNIYYQRNIMTELEAAILAKTFDEILTAMIEHPTAPARDAIGLPPMLKSESNPAARQPGPAICLLHSGFEANVESTPDDIALDFLHGGGARTVWSYRTLNEKANEIAHALIDQGVMPEDIIPVHMSKGPVFYASILGVLKAGAAFSPVHPGLPEARIRLMITDLNAKYVLCTKAAPVLDSGHAVKFINVDELQSTCNTNPVIMDLGSSNIAYCIFTSGSTGVPKAVSVEHRAPIQTIKSSESVVPWDQQSRLLQYAATTFDMCYYDCFLAWTFGFTLCSAEQDLLLNELSTTINTLSVDLLDLTPSVAASLTRAAVPSVKWLYCIGEAMTQQIVAEWGSACVNSYGPSEAAFCTTIFPVAKYFKPSIIGKPFPSTSFALFPAEGEHVLPLLSIGELYIGGAQLARGYHGRSQLTKEKFVTRNGQRFYRSGDVVRMLADGNFEFVGRTDDQVKIRGLRVELGEIDHAIRDAHSSIATAVTRILRRDAAAKEQLVAFLVVNGDIDDIDHEDLRHLVIRDLKSRLPLYMVPQFLLLVDHIPRSMAGKVDQKALTQIFRESIDASVMANGVPRYAAEHTWTGLETQIRGIFAHLSSSSSEDVSPSITIYQLGMDSISAVQIAAALRRLGHRVNAADIMKYPTCLDLAAFLNQKVARVERLGFDFDAFDRRHRAHVLASPNISRKEIAAIRPCTPLQRGMISQLLTSEGAAYISYLRLELKQGTDIDNVRQAWQKVMTIHPILRTGFVHLKDKDHPFGMIEYLPASMALPWDNESEPQEPEVWLRQIQRGATDALHRPLWSLRAIGAENTIYLDLAIFHGLFDAQSMQTILQDVVDAYYCQESRHIMKLDSTIDGILELSQGYGQDGKDFWTKMGQQATPCRFPNLAPLRYDPQPPKVCTYRSSKALSELEKACRQSNTSVQAAGLAGWLSLITAYTGESSACCGVVLSGRSFEEAEDAVFPCISTVPFGASVSAASKDTLALITSLIAEVQQHQHIPLNDIQRMMGHPTEALFDTIFAYQKLPKMDSEQSLWRIVDEKATTEYPISIELEPSGDHLDYRLTVLPHLVPPEHADMILGQLDHLIQSFIFPTERVHAYNKMLYSITPAQEPTIQSKSLLLHDFVEVTALEHPQRIAFEFVKTISANQVSASQWMYSELDEEGNRVANMLIDSGVRPGDLVGVCFEKCPEASFAMLGVLKAGAAFVAIDPGAPAARQTFIVQDSGAAAVLSMSTQSARFAADVQVPVLNLDKTKTSSFSSSKPDLNRAILPQDRSYCLYTSGTTGTPKGCELTHENAVQALLSFQRLFSGHWDADSRWLQFASFHFDVSVLEQYWSWSVGICVVSAPRDIIFEDLANSITTLGITHIDLTPSLAQLLHPDSVPTLCKGVFITGGESLKQEILDVWGSKGVIYNGYGPTEATIGCTMYPRVPVNGKPSNIGPQFDNVGTLVLRPGTDDPVVRGAVGELCVSGKLVGKGYLNRPDLTEKSFPYLDRFKERVYRTGDLVRILHDGSFEFLGRIDDQVKLRGQRLEIGEINSVIRHSNKSFSDVATLVLKHPRQQKEQLVAFVVQTPKNGSSQISLHTTSELRAAKDACHDKLAPYMVPTHFVPLTSLPLNVNNKADVKRLKEMYQGLSAADLQKLSASFDDHEQPWSNHELTIQKVLVEELGIEKEDVGKNTSFFELGMDSISAIAVTRALKHAGIPGVTTSLVMKNPTISRLAKADSTDTAHATNRASLLAAQQVIAALQHRHRRAVAQSLSVDFEDVEALAPCTSLQQGMIARSLESEDGLSFNTFRFELNDNVDERKLEEAWRAVFATTQILRTVFVETENGFMQAVMRNARIPWRAKRGMAIESANEDLAELRKEWLAFNSTSFKRPFELILLEYPEKKVLIMHIFHGLYDGISIELIFQAIWNAYCGHSVDGISPSFQSSLAYGPLRTLNGAKEFWQEHLRNHTISPHLLSPPSAGTISISIIRDLRELDQLDATRRRLNVTEQAVFQACWLSILQDHLGAAVMTGVVVSGRSIDFEGADHVVGPMFNTIPYQHRPQPSESWASAIQRAHEFNVSAHPYQHTPLRDIQKWCGNNRGQPLFDSLFVYQLSHGQQEWAENEVWKLKDGEAIADYPLAIEVEHRSDDTWRLTLVSRENVLDEISSHDLLSRFENALHQAVEDPETLFNTSVRPDDMNKGQQKSAVSPTIRTTDFAWSDDATTIRKMLTEMIDVELEEVSESTSIFELGLDSIDAIKLSARLKRHGIDLPVSGIMRGLTISKMLPNIRSTENATTDGCNDDTGLLPRKRQLKSHIERQEINTAEIINILPLTPLQEAMVAEMVTSQFERYFNFDVMKLEHGTDTERLRDAWTRVVAASPILRTSFVEVADPVVDDSFAQMVHSQPHEFWSKTTARMEEPDFSSSFEELRTRAKRTHQQEPPLYVQLVEGPTQTYLILAIAHALYDGWSLSLLHADVKRAYESKFEPRLDNEKVLSDILTTTGPKARQFWKDYLHGAPQSTFRRNSNKLKTPNVVHRLEINSKAQLPDLVQFGKKSNISLQTVGQTVFAIVLASYVHSLDVSFGSVLSGRDHETLSQLLFPTMNTVAFRTILHGTALSLLHHVQHSFMSIKQWQHFPLRKALAAAGAHGGLFESLFIYQKSVEDVDEEGPKLYTSVEGRSEVEYPVCVEMEVVHGQLMWRCAVKDEVFSKAGTQELLHRFDDVLHYMMQWPDKPVIDYTAHGISLCGLPSFEQTEEEEHYSPLTNLDGETNENDKPRPETVRAIREVLAAVSGTPEVEITNDMTIFHIGLDSISAIKVSNLLRRKGVILSVGEMLRAGTIKNIARTADMHSIEYEDASKDHAWAIRTALEDLNLDNILRGAAAQGCDITDMNEVDVLPATAGQVYMISMWLNTRGSNLYPVFEYTLDNAISFDNLQNAWKSLVAANSLLRTHFVATDDQRMPYVQLVRKLEDEAHPVIATTNEDQENDTQTTRQPWAYLRAVQSDGGWQLKLKIHHALYDGVSLPILMQQLRDFCNGSAVSPQANVIEKLIGSSVTPAVREQRQSFWSEYLANIEQSRLQQPCSPRMNRTSVFKPAALATDSMAKRAREAGVSVQALFLAAYARLFAKLTQTLKKRDVILGVYLANRSLPIKGVESAAIPTVNLLPLRVHVPMEQNLMDSAQQIQHDLQKIGELSNATASLSEISEWTGVKIDTFVNFLTFPDVEDTKTKQTAGDNVTITPKSGWDTEVNRIVEAESVFKLGDDRILQHLRNDNVNEAYLHAIDIEATVRDGALDMGVFAQEEMLDLATGNKLLEDLKNELQAVCA